MPLDHSQTLVTLRALRAYELDVCADPDLADDERAERLRDTAGARAVLEADQERATDHAQETRDELDRERIDREHEDGRAIGAAREAEADADAIAAETPDELERATGDTRR